VASRTVLLLSLFGLLGCNGPFFVFPGGKLDGEARPAPADWSFAGSSGTVQLETRPEEPYSVNVAFTVLNGSLYVNAGDTESRWAEHIAADPRVRLRLGGLLYELRAERVSDPAAIAAFGKAWTSQSVFRRDPAKLEQVWLFRLVPR
jgi:hypothetical protein